MPDQDSRHSRGVTRRGLLASAAGTAIGAGIGIAVENGSGGGSRTDARATTLDALPFYGRYQAGIATPTQNYLQFASFDLLSDSLTDLRQLLAGWTEAAATLTRGQPLGRDTIGAEPPPDPGEAIGLPPSALTITIGLGPGLFERNGRDRLGLKSREPSQLSPLPAFQGESLDPARSGGDLCIQACANDPQVAFHAIHALARIASTSAALRWLQAGFGRTSTTSRAQTTPRNLMGFKDGTNNIHSQNESAFRDDVWVQKTDGPAWMENGTYLALRRIRMLLDVWDSTSLTEQERTIGRHKLSGAPLGAVHEHDPVNLASESGGAPVIPTDAHIRLASPEMNAGRRILRRGYSYSDGYDPATGQLDAGLFFIAYQRSIKEQFIPLQARLAASDALNHHTLHTASAVFAIPPGATPGGYIGETLL